MSDAVEPFERRLLNGLFQVAQFSRRPAYIQFAGVADDGDAGGVIPPIFEATKTVEDERDDALGTDVTNYAAHGFAPGAAAVGLLPVRGAENRVAQALSIGRASARRVAGKARGGEDAAVILPGF
jgi:hypothetical protein